MKSGPDLFPELKPEGWRALASVKAPGQIALVLLCSKIAECFQANRKLGKSTAVDVVRLFGGRFSNNARRFIGAAAKIRTDIELPADFERRREVEADLMRIAKHLRPAWEKAGVMLAKIERGEQ